MRTVGILVGTAALVTAAALPLACGGNDFSSNGAGGASSSAGTGGVPVQGPCTVVEDCPGQDLPCAKRACNGGRCEIEDVVIGTPTPSQLAGDCKQVVCDGKGKETKTSDDSDIYDDGKECTTDKCGAGERINEPKPAGTKCNEGVCKGNSDCVECIHDTDCLLSEQVCDENHCVAPHCIDNVKDGGETDVDCGGSECAACPAGKQCGDPSDCVSGVCSSGVCQAPSCSDGVKNGTESDADCGGAICSPCADGQGCALPEDCQSGVCMGAVCQVGTCTDGVHNQDESDVDCGGSCPTRCNNGDACGTNVDCASDWCVMGKCVNHCLDGVTDADESDVDCGGTYCAGCPDGGACNCNGDCQSNVCCGVTASTTTQVVAVCSSEPCVGIPCKVGTN